MTAAPPVQALPDPATLEPMLARALQAAADAGATASEAQLSVARGVSVAVRMGEVESVQFQRDRELSVSVYFGQRTGSASTTDFSDAALADTVAAACAIARAGGEDPCVGLADPALLATAFPDLDLYHPWALSTEEAVDLARACEAAAFAADVRVRLSEGASLDTRQGFSLYANSHGFLGQRRSTDHSIGCAAIASADEAMQVGHWYTAARRAQDLLSPESVGREAGQRAAARLGARTLSTRSVPVLFPAEVARGLFGHFIGAISGGALYRRASFLLDALETQVFAERVHATQQPHLLRAAASAAFDSEGVATQPRSLIDAGVLRGWVLSSYSARKLGLQSTGNAGGVFNFVVEPTYAGGYVELAREMGRGLIVTELMGQGVNTVTGDYSRGASGFWVENGEIAYPVQEVTIAGNLREMFRGIAAIGSDVDTRGGVRCGAVLLDHLTVAGSAA